MSEEIYTSGDWIVHAYYGVGQVKGRDKKTLEGEKNTFLRVKTFSSEYFLPIKKWDASHIRPLCSEYQFKRALSILRKPAEPLSKDYRKRSKQILEAASDISIYSKAQIIRDLYGKKRAGKLNFREKEYFEKIIDQYLNEWSVVVSRDKGSLREKLNKSLRISFEKLKDKDDESRLEKVRKGVKEK